jgi:NitT/TauT family transport system substrate-binding protein
MMRSTAAMLAVAALAMAVILTPPAVAAEMQVRVASQFGLAYLPLIIMQHDRSWEALAKAEGVDLTVGWNNLGGGGALNDAVLSDSADLAAGGVAPMLKVWDKTRKKYDVRAVAALNSNSFYIVTNKPQIHTLRDFTEADKIAVPTIKVSLQAIMLQMAAEREFGLGQHEKLDTLTVSMKHPDALISLLSQHSSISAHVSSSPFQEQELASPGIHKLVDYFAVMGGPATFSVVWAKENFVSRKPVAYATFLRALDAAMQSIKADPAAARKYLAVIGDKASEAATTALIVQPDNIYTMAPQATAKLADFMLRTGSLTTRPASWKDYFFAGVYALDGS